MPTKQKNEGYDRQIFFDIVIKVIIMTLFVIKIDMHTHKQQG